MIAMKTKYHESNELEVIHQLLPLNSERKELLLHPIINTFIMIKYNSYAIPLMFIIAIRFMLSALMTDIILKHDMGQNTTQRATIGFIEKPISFWISFSFVTFVLVINLIYTIIYTMVIKFRRLDRRQIMFKTMGVIFYMSSLIFLAFLAIGQVNNRCAGLLVLACWANFTTSLRFLMLGELYNLGLYIRMVNQIGQKIAILLAVYSFILFGFTVAFSILMPEQFKGPWEVGMMAMLIGEFDFGDSLESKSATNKLVFLFFVILVPIIINNLLIGLTINDVDDMIKNANMSGLKFKLRQIDMLDRSHMMRLLSRLAKYSSAQSHLLSYKHNSLEVLAPPVTHLACHPQVAIKPYESQENLLSKEPITNIFEVVCV
jgi:transient receptor potential cation channel subfamily A protein 1